MAKKTLLPLLTTCFLLLPRGFQSMSTPFPPEDVKEIEGVEGGNVQLPCELFSHDQEDKINLILWYKNEQKDPVYSYDARLAVFSSERHHLKDSLLKGRVTFAPSPGGHIAHKLTLSRLQQIDAGYYTCRVDFTMAQSSTKAVLLKIVTPVSSLSIVDSQGRQTSSILEPIPEGGTLNITCTAKGGRPRPAVSWWVDDAMIDDSWTEVAKGVVSNNLVISPLARAHAHAVLTCRAAPASVAMSTATVTIDMHLKPESVKIDTGGTGDTIRAGEFLDLTCVARGSRPKPNIMWYKGTESIQTKKSSLKGMMGVSAISHARVRILKEDNGVRVTCRVTNPALPHQTLTDFITLNVTYPPEVELRMGSTLEGTVVKESTDLYLTCYIDANPMPEAITFTHQGVVVEQDLDRGIVLSARDLVLRGIQRTQSGIYTCRGVNNQGSGTSSNMNITVLYAPVCRHAPEVFAEPGSQVVASCSVSSSPMNNLHFSWVWVTPTYSRRIMPALVTVEGLSSNVSFAIPQDNSSLTDLGSSSKLGILECWARNEVGRQAQPCTIAVRKTIACSENNFDDRSSSCMSQKKHNKRPLLPPAPPSAPVNCSLAGVGRERVRVTCMPGDSSMPQTYQLQIYEARTRKLHINVTSSKPSFIVSNLTAGRDYTVYVSSHTSHGGSPFKLVEAFNFHTAENRMREDDDEPLSWITILIFGGSGGGLVIFIIFIACLIRIRMRRSQHKCTVRRTPTTNEPKLADKNLYLDTPPEVPPISAEKKFDSGEPSSTFPLETNITQKPIIRDPLNPPSIIRQNTGARLQPIIKENGRAEPVRSSQPRTVLFVEPPKTRNDSLARDDDMHLTPYDTPYSNRRIPGAKMPIDDARSPLYHSSRENYSSNLSPYLDRTPPDIYEPSYTTGGQPGSSILNRDSDYSSRHHLPTNSAYRRNPSLLGGLKHNSASDLPQRDSQGFPFQSHGIRDRDRENRDNIYDVPLHRTSSSPPIPRHSIMKKSPSVTGTLTRRYEHGGIGGVPSISTRPDGSSGPTYRSLPRPNKSRYYDPDSQLAKYKSLDRRFDIPFTGSLPRPQSKEPRERPRPERQLSLNDTSSDSRFDFRTDHRSSSLRSDFRFDRADGRYDTRSTFRSSRDPSCIGGSAVGGQRRNNGTTRLRFANEKYFHVYPEKDKRQNCIDDDDENFV